MSHHHLLKCLFGATLLFGQIQFAEATTYFAQQIPTLGGATNVASGINNLGQVVGTSYTTQGDPVTHGLQRAFLTGYNGNGLQMFGTVNSSTYYVGPYPSSYGNAVNDSGKIVGTEAFFGFNSAITGDSTTGAVNRVPSCCATNSFALSVNEQGTVVGYSRAGIASSSVAFYTNAPNLSRHPL